MTLTGIKSAKPPNDLPALKEIFIISQKNTICPE